MTFSGSLWSFRERGLGELAMAFSLSLRGKRQSRRGKSGFKGLAQALCLQLLLHCVCW